CKQCPVHCYQPAKREEMKQIMRWAGPRMLWRHPILTIRHLLDVAYIFINSGTDYPPVIEAWAKARATGQKVPELVICPHENA
ncbi:nitrous oxide-stimulated promoter family protein, partial [Klebsiella pneumoniae]|uniref:nitrous oxide-stimulated promoter family protein n=1 Tax=Klebsiella pneumoniae TaxID=573 RepID=UPI003B42B01A